MASIDSQPLPIPSLGMPSSPSKLEALRETVSHVKRKVTTKEGWIGDYDYACKERRLPPFYALDDSLPLLLGMTSGLQHSLAMLAGLITPPMIFASALSLDAETSAYMISASLIGCGILSFMQMSRIHLWGRFYLGTGLLTVVGTSFATLSTANSIFNAMYRDGTCPSTIGPSGIVIRGSCPDAYGMVLGTSLVCSFLNIFMSFCSPRILKRLFPPIVTGTVILMIGASLIGESGIANWGGGSNNCKLRPDSGFFELCPNINAPRPLPWGSAEFIGLGFLSFSTIIVVEMFGSPFMRNISIICGLVVGCIVAGATGYMSSSSIDSAPAITFLWVKTFKIGVYPPAILPMLAVYISLAMEAIGDITASAEVSKQVVTGPVFDSRIQGGVLGDGISGFVSALFTVTPLSTFAQNNGVIAITRCANRGAGRWCCFFLILFGTIGKLAGIFLAIPPSVLGGVTTFLFANVAASGIRVLAGTKFSRRDRFVLAAALSFGVGNLLNHSTFTYLFERVETSNKGLQGLFDSITIVLSTPFLSAGVVATVLNLILPTDIPEKEGDLIASEEATDDESVEKIDVEAQLDEKSSKLHSV
ncbi:purine permease [Coprinopsis marcescibilis]|uniref:Purine permease n=1 Tax=Coprinopsis marcescibilis TaxID=230819 RepID=A0A5C3LK21_COPMA|nr:purine permease [Coprinopsis marcescibilis]